MKSKFVFIAMVSVVSLLAPYTSMAQGSSLDADLKKQFKVTRFAVDSTGLVVSDQGVVLAIRKPGIRAFPPATFIVPTTKYQDGRVETPPNNPMLGPNRLLPVDTRVYVMKISVDAKKDKVTMIIVECDSCNGVQQPSYYKGQVAFQFSQGYLQGGADAGQVGDVISELLGPDNPDQGGQGGQGSQDNQNAQGGQQQGQGGQPQYQSQDAPKQPQTIEKGQTEEQVLAILGQPDKIVNLGAKKLYIYKDMKITFIGGKVSDVS
jgi:hypothetical protein